MKNVFGSDDTDPKTDSLVYAYDMTDDGAEVMNSVNFISYVYPHRSSVILVLKISTGNEYYEESIQLDRNDIIEMKRFADKYLEATKDKQKDGGPPPREPPPTPTH
jgi:hypothetical protein